MELRIFLEQFATRIESVRPAGDASRTHASFVDGYEPLPINWTLR